MKPVSDRVRTGISLAEIFAGLALSVMVMLMVKVAFKTMARNESEVQGAASMHREIKSIRRLLETDIRRAGFGMEGSPVFTVMESGEIRFRYRDLLQTHCAWNETAAISYLVEDDAVMRTWDCNGKVKGSRKTGESMDSLALAFTYLDEAGQPAGSPAAVRTVRFALSIHSRSRSAARKPLSLQSSIIIANRQ